VELVALCGYGRSCTRERRLSGRPLTFLFRHAQNVLWIDFAYHVRMVARKVSFDRGQEFLVRIAADDFTAFTVDELAHGGLQG
jgi:hypothetical protein